MTLTREKIVVASALAFAMPPSFVLVSSLGGKHPVPPPSWLTTPLDSAIAVVPLAVWAYISWYPSSLAVLLAGRENFRRLCVAEFIAFLLCSTIHILWPVTIERPALDALTGASARALRAIYAIDKPVSLFPSFHAAVAPILVQLRPSSPLLRVFIWAWMGSICLSCVLTKQHYVLDVVAGLAVGGMSVVLAERVLQKTAETQEAPSAMPSASG